jgi:hypothetical protein
MKLPLIWLIFLVAFSVSANERPDLQGDRLGMTLSSFKEKYARTLPSHSQPAPPCTDLNPMMAHIEMEPRIPGAVRCMREFPFEELQTVPGAWGRWTPNVTLGGKPARIIYTFFANDSDEEPTLILISATSLSADFSTLKSGLSSRFGGPSSTETRTYTNRMGATFTGEILQWESGTDMIELRQYSDTIEFSTTLVADTIGLSVLEDVAAQERARDAAQDM